MKLSELNLICITNCTACKNVLKFGRLILKQRLQLERGQLGSYWLELSILTLFAFIALRWMETPLDCTTLCQTVAVAITFIHCAGVSVSSLLDTNNYDLVYGGAGKLGRNPK